MSDKDKTKFITDVLYKKYAKVENTFAFKELGVENERGQYKRIDLYTINSFRSKKFYAKAFEIKVSRADFKNDFKKENKQDMAIVYSNEFYYVTPPKLVSKEEVPDLAGLIEVNEEGKCKIVKRALKREKCECCWHFLILTLRNKTKQEMEEQRVINFDNKDIQCLKQRIKNLERDIKSNHMFIKQFKNALQTVAPMVKDKLGEETPVEIKYLIEISQREDIWK